MIVGIDGRELQGRPTGTGRYLRSLLRAWSRRGPARLVLYFNGPAPGDPILHQPAIEVRALGARPARGLWWSERRLPAAARADGVHAFFAPAYTCPLSLDLPRVTAVHDMSFFAVPDDFTVRDGIRRRLLVGASLRASHTILTISEFTRREIARFFPDLASRVAHVPLGPDEDLSPPPPRTEARRRLGVRGPMVLSVGTILNRRHLPTLLRAVHHLRRPWPGLILDVVGENRTHPRLDIAGMIKDLELEDTARATGYLDEASLADRYAAADACVFLSDYEGFGLPVLEAMSRGVPVVTSRRLALVEIFGEAALLVDPTDERDVAAALERVLGDAALRQDLVRRGRALAARYSWNETARLTLQHLQSAARQPT